jgi:hypothetical protein
VAHEYPLAVGRLGVVGEPHEPAAQAHLRRRRARARVGVERVGELRDEAGAKLGVLIADDVRVGVEGRHRAVRGRAVTEVVGELEHLGLGRRGPDARDRIVVGVVVDRDHAQLPAGARILRDERPHRRGGLVATVPGDNQGDDLAHDFGGIHTATLPIQRGFRAPGR